MDMVETGKKIARLRREAGITQMALADKLNISFQAVSNWERGQTMPDIAKLYELSDIFGVSIDTILGNTRNAEILSAADTGVMPEETPTIDELAEVAPILKTAQTDTLAEIIIEKEGKIMDVNSILKVIDYLSEDFINEIADKIYNQGGTEAVLPFMDYLWEETISKIAYTEIKKSGDLNSITAFMDHIDEDTLNDIARKVVELNGIDAVMPIIDNIDTEILEDYIRKNLEI